MPAPALTWINTARNAPPKLDSMYKKILVPTDGSALSKKAIRAAVALAGSLDAEIVTLNVVPTYPVSYFEGGLNVDADEVGRIERQWAEKGLAIAEQGDAAAQSAGVKSKAVTVRSDSVSESILAAARKHRCDLIVMASHGHRGLKRLLLGSETQHVLTHGSIPVLVLR
jgi:nucleotide-binding universal stress UspA family protein